MEYLPHQTQKAELITQKIRRHGFCVLAMQERTGKTGCFLKAVEDSKAKTCLVVTKKAAIVGIESQIKDFGCTKDYTVINYQSLHKLTSTDFDILILDECHTALQSYPKPSVTHKTLKPLCADKPIIYVSATPFSESYSQAFHLLQLSTWTPFKHKNFYAFHKEHGIPCEIYMHGRVVQQYKLTKDLKHTISPYLITMTRLDAGFEHEPSEEVHTVPLDDVTKRKIATIRKDKMLSEPLTVCDSAMAEVNAVYQLSGGGIGTGNDYTLLSSEKIDYILSTFGDAEDIAIMCHYKAEQQRLSEEFKYSKVFSSTSHAEGVDLSMFKTLIIYSLDFSTSRHSQRTARQANINRKTPIVVHFLLSDGGIDSHVYDTVSVKKQNFTQRIYNGERATTTKEDNKLPHVQGVLSL